MFSCARVRRPFFAATASLLISAAGLVAGSAPASSAQSAKVPRCHSTQIREALKPIEIVGNATDSYEDWVTLTNIGALCNMPVVYVGFEAFQGDVPLVSSTVPASLVTGNNLLRTGQSARAEISVGLTNSRALKNSCKAKAANVVKVLGPYEHWPEKSFHLSNPVLVCTGSSNNLGGGWLFKTP